MQQNGKLRRVSRDSGRDVFGYFFIFFLNIGNWFCQAAVPWSKSSLQVNAYEKDVGNTDRWPQCHCHCQNNTGSNYGPIVLALKSAIQSYKQETWAERFVLSMKWTTKGVGAFVYSRWLKVFCVEDGGASIQMSLTTRLLVQRFRLPDSNRAATIVSVAIVPASSC